MQNIKKKIVKIYQLFPIVVLVIVLLSSVCIGNSNEYLARVDQMPEMVGGMGSLNKYLEYPQPAQQANVQGKVFVLVFINESGSVDDVKVVKGIGMGCDEAAIQAVKKLKFKPGVNNGENVKVKFAFAIDFRLS
ncbi:MAG: energy transducer TonB [Bacteroidetes bacterium]|nr:energy transducer TonB [Bacteroidota bacterium]